MHCSDPPQNPSLYVGQDVLRDLFPPHHDRGSCPLLVFRFFTRFFVVCVLLLLLSLVVVGRRAQFAIKQTPSLSPFSYL